jgi:hypothetical protein
MAMACSCTKHWPWPHGGHGGGHPQPHCSCSIPDNWTCVVVPQTYVPHQGDLYSIPGTSHLSEVGAGLTTAKETHVDTMVAVPSTPYAVGPVFCPTGGSSCSLRTVRSLADLQGADSLLQVFQEGVGGYAYKRNVTFIDSAHIVLGPINIPFHVMGSDTFAVSGNSVTFSKIDPVYGTTTSGVYNWNTGSGTYVYTAMLTQTRYISWLIPR